MLTKRQNMLETVRGGTSDRYVNQYEALALIRRTPFSVRNAKPAPGGPAVKNAWGVWNE